MNKEKRAPVETIIKNFLLSYQVVITDVPSDQLLNMVCDDILGSGIIEPLQEDKDVTNIYINGTKEIIYEKIGEGECAFPYRFETEEEVKALTYKMVNSTSESLNTAKAYVEEAFYPNGTGTSGYKVFDTRLGGNRVLYPYTVRESSIAVFK